MVRAAALLATALALACSATEPQRAPAPVPAVALEPVMVPLVLACPALEPEPALDQLSSRGDDALTLVPAAFADLPGWTADHHAEAIPAFRASCEKLAALPDDARVGVSAYAGRARDWRAACARAAALAPGDDDAARRLFEQEFEVYAARGRGGFEGKLTGYHVQQLRGSRTRHGKYQVPIRRRPDDLYSVELSAFIPDGRGRRIWGRIDAASGKLVPYPTRAELRRAPVADDQVLLWVDDPVDAVFAEIQGSGKVTLDDGSTVSIAFAGKNGRRFRGVAGILRRLGEIERGSNRATRAWFEAHPERFDDIADRNPAKVFFELSPRAGAIGSQGVVLTPRRSLAVDRAVIAHSTPVWVDTRAPETAAGPTGSWRHLVIAQDTGGSILGPVRGDIYWGDDRDAAELAARTGGPGRMWLLLPRHIDVH